MVEDDDVPTEEKELYRSRAFNRGMVSIDATIRERLGTKHSVGVIDLSRSGFRMRCMYHIPDRRTVYLNMPGFESMEANIMWHKDVHYGCAFAKRLHESVYDHLLRQFPQLRS